MQAFLLLMVFGNTFVKWSIVGCLLRMVNATYRTVFHINTIKTTKKLNENMISNNVPRTDVIISANSEIGKPIITARFLIFL